MSLTNEIVIIRLAANTINNNKMQQKNAQKLLPSVRAAPFGSDMHQIVCRPGFAPDPTGGAYSALPDTLAGLEGGARGKRRREGKKMRGGKGGEGVPECPNPELASLAQKE